ncbi:hypothetical protein ACJMK2_017884 [Sinanodonta woodiana]|uniref:EF-hand domain-containing protein n=1 Tax=Sinanodonta woodiana TaxID=1069815 RepID=A0ABD3UBQ7_SINWO
MAHEMSPDQIEEYKKAFSVFDKDGDGRISTVDLRALLGSLDQKPSQALLEDIITGIDAICDGTIKFDEFLKMMTTKIDYSNTVTDEGLRDAFRVFDRDGNGFITATDLRQVMINIGDKLTDEEVHEMIREIDTHGDGMVNYEDFLAMMAQE